MQKRLYILGAGPGDPDLITVKGARLLQNAKVVLYDNLANAALLDLLPTDAERIYVGKYPYGDYTPQEKIHELILEKIEEKGEVIRLKGGDPFIFGRGFEEMQFAAAYGINSEYIPGVTSMQVSGIAGIPLTYRSMSEGIWVITGTKKDGSLSGDLRMAMKSNATVVVYMGMKKMQHISDTYITEGLGDTPAAVIQHGSLEKERSVRGAIKDMPQLVEKEGLTHPAIIIIGKVADLKI